MQNFESKFIPMAFLALGVSPIALLLSAIFGPAGIAVMSVALIAVAAFIWEVV